MAEEKVQINIQVSAQDAAAIDALTHKDGYDKRSSWIRRVMRREIELRRSEIVAISTLPHPADAQSVPVLHVSQGR